MGVDKKTVEEMFRAAGIEFEQTFTIKRGPPTPAEERRDDVIAGVRTMNEALERIAAIPRPAPKKK